jgi:hypothetical protein
LVIGEERDGAWRFAEAVKNGFVPATRRQMDKAIGKLTSDRAHR